MIGFRCEHADGREIELRISVVAIPGRPPGVVALELVDPLLRVGTGRILTQLAPEDFAGHLTGLVVDANGAAP